MVLDTFIIGGGPAGIAVANTLQKEGLNVLAADRGPIANNIMHFPVFMQFFSSRDLLVIDDFPMTIPEEKPDRRQYLTYLNNFVESRKIQLLTYTEVLGVEKTNGVFSVQTKNVGNGKEETFQTKSVVTACGAYERPRYMNVPGEDLPKVSHYFSEPHPYFKKKVMVVGGRNSAIETALILYRSGAHVSLSYRREDLSGSGIKYWIKPDIEARLRNGEITPYLSTNVKRIDQDSVVLTRENGEEIVVENDYVIALTGYEPPAEFMDKLGIKYDPETKAPEHNPETLETPVRGHFIAGVITCGNISGKVFIENSRHHGELILKGLRGLV